MIDISNMKKTYVLKCGEVTATAKNQKVTDKMLCGMHFAYTIELKKDGVKKSFTFHDSVYNYRRNQGPTEEMINDAVDCILSDAFSYENAADVYDFAEEFGYDYEEEEKDVNRIYNGCKKTYYKLSEILDAEGMMELSEVVRGK